MPSSAVATISVRNAIRRFRHNRRGSAAVEFALIAPVFFALLFAIIETGLLFFAGQVLETGTQDSARLMYTHQAYDTGMDETAFKTDLCSRYYAPGAAINLTDPIVSGSLTGPFTYQVPPPGSANTVVVRVFYQWPLYVTGLGFNISNLNGSQRLLAATAAFHVEP